MRRPRTPPVQAQELRAKQFLRVLSHVGILAGLLLGLTSPGRHQLWLLAGIACFVLVIELPDHLVRWVPFPAFGGLLALAIGLAAEPGAIALYCYLFYICTAVAATRLRWPYAIALALTAFGLLSGAQYGWLMGGEHQGQRHDLIDLAGFLLLTVLVKELVDGQRRGAQLNRRLERQAHTDDLTGLPNYRALMQRFDELVLHGTNPLAVVMLDLDNFKYCNDRFGHQAGDEVLRHIGRELAAALPPGAVVGRYGGDEFFVLLPELDRENANCWAAAFTQQLAASALAVPGGGEVTVGASFGIAVGPADGQTRQALYAQADRALYRAKSQRSATACETAD